jgi:hypothetical protein
MLYYKNIIHFYLIYFILNMFNRKHGVSEAGSASLIMFPLCPFDLFGNRRYLLCFHLMMEAEPAFENGRYV